MGFMIRQGKMQMGAEPARICGSLINRAAGVSLIGEPLMCDIDTTSYDTDADDGGAYGNGITATAGGVNTISHLISPYGCVTEAGVAVGSRVQVCFHGITNVLVNQAVASPAAKLTLIQATGQRYASGIAANISTNKILGWTHDSHATSGSTILTKSLFHGVGGR